MIAVFDWLFFLWPGGFLKIKVYNLRAESADFYTDPICHVLASGRHDSFHHEDDRNFFLEHFK